jgi:hypothetical protein
MYNVCTGLIITKIYTYGLWILLLIIIRYTFCEVHINKREMQKEL